jgi:hypothetical protein
MGVDSCFCSTSDYTNTCTMKIKIRNTIPKAKAMSNMDPIENPG